MKTRVIEIEIAGPNVSDETVERVMKAVNDIMGNFYPNDNISIEVREQISRTLFTEPCPMPMTPCPDRTFDPIFYWYNQPTCSVPGKGGCR